MTPDEIKELRRLLSEARTRDQFGVSLDVHAVDKILDAAPALLTAVEELAALRIEHARNAELLAAARRDRDEARATAERLRPFAPVWRRLGVIGGQVTYTLEVAGRSLGHFVSQRDGTWYSGQQREHATAEDAARAVCAALGIPDVEVHDAALAGSGS